jgi:hypothetical protein
VLLDGGIIHQDQCGGIAKRSLHKQGSLGANTGNAQQDLGQTGLHTPHIVGAETGKIEQIREADTGDFSATISGILQADAQVVKTNSKLPLCVCVCMRRQEWWMQVCEKVSMRVVVGERD